MKGFAFIEILIVFAIIGLVAAVTLPAYLDSKDRRDNPEKYEEVLACISGYAFQKRGDGKITPILDNRGNTLKCG